MAKRISDLDMNDLQVLNVRLQNLATSPTAKIGKIYFNTAENAFKGFLNDGTEVNLGNNYTFSTGLEEDTSTHTVTLKIASASQLGGVIEGTNVSISATGEISVANASTSGKGVIEIATDTEVATGTDTTRAVTPKQLAGKVSKLATAPTAGTYTKVTITSDGLVSSGGSLQASDIPSITLSKISDVTATATELNILDGATGTTEELNILDGVTVSASDINSVTSKISLSALSIDSGSSNYLAYDSATGKFSAKVDTAPANNSTKLITSGGVYTALADKVTKNTAITAGTKCKITYDTKGLVTAGDDLSASDIPDLSAIYLSATLKGANNGVAELDSTGKVPSAQLPSFVDDVIDAYIVSGATALSAGWLSATSGGSALTPETGKIYVVLSSGEYLNKTYRWSGTTYVEISGSPAQASESVAGIAELATQTEVNTGTDDQRIVTPKKLATYVSGMAKKITATNPALTSTNGICTWSITNSLGTADVIVQLRETSSGEVVYADYTLTSGTVTVTINSTSNITAGTYTAVIIG